MGQGFDDYMLTHTVEDLHAGVDVDTADIDDEIVNVLSDDYEEWKKKKEDALNTPVIGRLACTDMGNGERLYLRQKDNLAWTNDIGWRYWDGKRWKADTTQEIERRAGHCIRQIYAEASQTKDQERRERLGKWAAQSESRGHKAAMIKEAESLFAKDFPIEVWDKNNSLINLQNGTLNLDTGEFYDHRPSDHITKLMNVSYDPAAESPLWLSQLKKFVPDLNDQQFLQRSIGYSISGDTSNTCFFILYGEGGNGKSTFIETVFNLMGDYAGKIAVDTIIDSQKTTSIESDLASLHGLRMALASEPNARKKLNTSIIKQMTGDVMRGKLYYHDPFSFRPTHKLWIETNHKLSISDDDDGTWRRLKQLPWTVQIQESDMILDFKEKLISEWSGILNWMIDGYKKWKLTGVGESPNSQSEKAKYRHDEDIVSFFLDENYNQTHNHDDLEERNDFLDTYQQWCKHTGTRSLSVKNLYPRLRKKGIGEYKSHGIQYWTGIRKIKKGQFDD